MLFLIEILAQELYNGYSLCSEGTGNPNTPKVVIPDRTKEATQLLKDNAKEMVNTGIGSIPNPLIIVSAWYDYVKPGGQWDYKLPKNRPDWMPEDGKFMLNGQVVTAEAFGNINYGYTGTALGFGEKTLFTGGGWAAGKEGTASKNKDAPLYGDSQEDHDNIQGGINMYYNDNSTMKYLKWTMINIDVRPILDLYNKAKGGK